MRRRPSGSSIEEDEDTSSPSPSPPLEPGDKTRDSSYDSLNPSNIEFGPKDRRRNNETVARLSMSKSRGWNAQQAAVAPTEKEIIAMRRLSKDISPDSMIEAHSPRRSRWRNPWACSLLTVGATVLSLLLLFTMVQSFLTRQLDTKGYKMSYMRPAFARYPDFDTEHTRFASKYSLYLYRELGIDDDTRVKGIPVLFVPGNAGSYKQVRPLAAWAANHFQNEYQHDQDAIAGGKRPLDFFSVDFNEDITAFHGQTMLDQAEYLNDAVAFILSLYHDPNRSFRDPNLPDPSSVILIGHSMGGIVARTMMSMPNYQDNSVNTIITLASPHARPPVSFDADIVKTYRKVNDYWRQAYSQKWASDNPLWHVTTISIAGGGLDTMVPSDYASLSSLVPETHGFTVFTASIPDVWTGMDHLSITWADQLRKAVVGALYDVVDANRNVQTRPRAERMRAFKKRFLTGLESIAEKTLPHKEPKTLLTLEDNSNYIISQGERLTLRQFGEAMKQNAYLLPVPPQGAPEGRKFTLLTDQVLDSPGDHGSLEVLFCSVFPLHVGASAALFSMNMDLSGESTGSTRLTCKNAASDVIELPASTRESKYSFDDARPFSYLQYDLEDLAEHQFVAVVDKASSPRAGWAVAEFTASAESVLRSSAGLWRLLVTGVNLRLPARRPMVMDVKIPALRSSLLAYNLKLSRHSCGDDVELFTPLLRQYVTEVFESKFFVNVREANINLHGVAPYMPPQLRNRAAADGLSLQIWSDPTCNTSMRLSMQLDIVGSMGKLWMRYRTVFAAFPLLVVALALRNQFKNYDETGIFMSFSESINQCLRSSLPVLLIALTFLSGSLAKQSQEPPQLPSHWMPSWKDNATETAIDYTKNDLLLGSQDPFFWFLVPLFGAMSIGVCVILNYVVLGLTHVFSALYGRIRRSSLRGDDGRRTPTAFAVTSTRQRMVTTGFLLLLVSTVLPYHFAYMVLCLVQIATAVRAYRLMRDTKADTNYNFYNYVHSVLILMIWIIPINAPVLVVWIRNLAVHWFTPFSSHHNILSIMPFILLVETISTGRMIPRVTTRLRHITSLLLFTIAVYSAVYGVTYAYLLHHCANIFSAWLVAIHLSTSSFSFSRLSRLLDSVNSDGHHTKKRP